MKQLILVLGSAATFATAAAVFSAAAVDTVPASLSAVFQPGTALQDRNGDGAIDFVNARIVLPERPDASELAAASNIAARLGFETSAMDIPMVRLKPPLDGARGGPELRRRAGSHG